MTSTTEATSTDGALLRYRVLAYAVGVLLVTGEWTTLSNHVRDWFPSYTAPV